MIVTLNYYTIFGDGDCGDTLEWEVEIDGAAEKAYLQAKEEDRPFTDFPELMEVLSEARKEIEEDELANFADDEYAMECLGLDPVDPDDINIKVKARDEYTLDLLGLQSLSEEELDNWDANNLDENRLPRICDFDKDFEPMSPFDLGWSLVVEFEEDEENEEDEEDEEF